MQEHRIIRIAVQGRSGWVIRGEHGSVLIDCPTREPARWLSARGLPPAVAVLHTACDPDLVCEGARLPESSVVVATGERERCTDPHAWKTRAHTTWDKPEEWMTTMGAEAYGIAGSITRRAPVEPVPTVTETDPGSIWEFAGLRLRSMALPAHDRHALGWVLEHASGVPQAFFCGDLMMSPGVLPTLHRLEYAYHQMTLERLPGMLRTCAELNVPFYPATGPQLIDGPARARQLADRIEDHFAALAWQPPAWKNPPAMTALRTLGRWSEVTAGVWQIGNFGNAILFIASDGAGMLVDPGPCDFGNPHRERDFLADMERFSEVGLRRIEVLLITHVHGDHYDLAPLIRQRYPGVQLVALDLVGAVIDAPWDYPYPALLPWYGGGRDERCDIRVQAGETWRWNEAELTAAHLPGHTWAHAGYLVVWRGQRIALTGDVVQGNGETLGLFYALCNDSPPGNDDGCIATMERLIAWNPDLNMGGHSSHFQAPMACYRASLQRMRHALPSLAALVPDGDLQRACLPPGYPR